MLLAYSEMEVGLVWTLKNSENPVTLNYLERKKNIQAFLKLLERRFYGSSDISLSGLALLWKSRPSSKLP